MRARRRRLKYLEQQVKADKTSFRYGYRKGGKGGNAVSIEPPQASERIDYGGSDTIAFALLMGGKLRGTGGRGFSGRPSPDEDTVGGLRKSDDFEKAQFPRCASLAVAAAYGSTPHSTRIARLELGRFTKSSHRMTLYEIIKSNKAVEKKSKQPEGAVERKPQHDHPQQEHEHELLGVNCGIATRRRGLQPDSVCSAWTPSSAYFCSIRHEMRISEVLIIMMLTPRGPGANIRAATPGWLRMPTR